MKRSSERGKIGQVAPHKFPIHQPLCRTFRNGKRSKVAAAGQTVYMSSHEIGFTANPALSPGQRVEMSVNWPVKLDRTCGLKLVICGHVLQNDRTMAVVKIEHYEFHTR